jgi:hypothetical protein
MSLKIAKLMLSEMSILQIKGKNSYLQTNMPLKSLCHRILYTAIVKRKTKTRTKIPYVYFLFDTLCGLVNNAIWNL